MKPKISFLGCKFFKKEYSYFFIIYNPFLKDFYMHILHTVSLILLALGCNNITYGMHTAPRSLQKFSRPCSYIEIAKPVNTQEGRKQAYQQWCPTQINWNNNTESKTSIYQVSPRSHKEEMVLFCKQCGKKQEQ